MEVSDGFLCHVRRFSFFGRSALFGGACLFGRSFVRARRAAAVSVGCAAGADALALSAAVAAGASGRSLRVFAVGASSGAGFWSGSALSGVRLAAAAGASVAWLAGGSLSVPLRARLLRRSLAALRGCSAAVFFLASPSSPGSLRVASAAAAAGLPVFVFCCGFAGFPASLAGCSGSWVSGSFAGFPCLVWAPAAAQLPLVLVLGFFTALRLGESPGTSET